MKKQWSFSLAILGLVLSAAANASPMQWTDDINFQPAELVSLVNPVTFTHDITDAASGGYTPGWDWATSYELVLNLWDDDDSAGEVARIAQPVSWLDPFSVTYFNLSGTEYGGWSLVGALQLLTTGHLTVTVTADRGDFYLGSSHLTVGGTTTRGVPEPGTLGLLGAALLGFGVLRRRRLV